MAESKSDSKCNCEKCQKSRSAVKKLTVAAIDVAKETINPTHAEKEILGEENAYALQAISLLVFAIEGILDDLPDEQKLKPVFFDDLSATVTAVFINGKVAAIAKEAKKRQAEMN